MTEATNRRNRRHALAFAAMPALAAAVAGWFIPAAIGLLVLCPVFFWLARRRCVRRVNVMKQPFPDSWEKALVTHVAFFRALPEAEKIRFRQIVMVFLDEVRITGIRTEVDDATRVLVAASAAIPVFGFQDWEYHRLGEVLLYPGSFGENFQLEKNAEKNTLGMVGTSHLRGVMILSKPSLFEGFDNPTLRDNVGIHEFTHLVELEEIDHGIPLEVPWQAVKHWVNFVSRELAHPPKNHSYIRGYAYTNEHEFLAVLAEYFFKSPESLRKKDPELYGMMRAMFHQDTFSLLKAGRARPFRYGRNSPCPCGSGKKYKHCCLPGASGAGRAEDDR